MTTRGRTERAAVTRERLLDAAERLFAEHGVHPVSHRAIADAAGQGNTAVVGYHFGTKADLVRALVRRRTEAVEAHRVARLARIEGSRDVRDWVEALVRPQTDHLAALAPPTWFARFAAQVMADPTFWVVMTEESMTSPTLLRTVEGLHACLPGLPDEVRHERRDIGRLVMVGMFAERERALAEGTSTPRVGWDDAADGLVDALVGVWTAPVRSRAGS